MRDKLDIDQLAALDAQYQRCAICGSIPKNKKLSVDHCHSTGRIRGLICTACNLGLGCFRDDPKLLGRAIEYLGRRKSLKAVPRKPEDPIQKRRAERAAWWERRLIAATAQAPAINDLETGERKATSVIS